MKSKILLIVLSIIINLQPTTKNNHRFLYLKCNHLNKQSDLRENHKTFDGSKIHHLRLERKMSMTELSHETGVPVCTIWRIEHGKSIYPTYQVVFRIAEYFNVPMETFKPDSSL